jgi:serine/threonine protein kinase
MVMEYAANGSLFKFYTRIIKDKVDISSVDVYKYFFQTVQALKYLHSQDIMHRDIKVNCYVSLA